MRKLTLLVMAAMVCPHVALADEDDLFRRGGTREPRGHGGVLLSLSALVSPSGLAGVGAVTIPFDRVVKGAAQMHASLAYLPATPDVARQAVTEAWRVAGLGSTDAALDAMASRTRWSALLPEARVRILRHATDSTRATATDSSATETPFYAYDSNSLWVEGRFTWRLDRLVFADEEPTIERLRLEHHDQRMKIAAKVVEHISKWQRAHFDVSQSPDGSLDRVDALMREMESSSMLDAMTAGWFSRWEAGDK